VTMATAVGACNVEAADALSGICSWEATCARLDAGWQRRPLQINTAGWSWDAAQSLWLGPENRFML
jgi:hypothetical protein